MKSKLTDNAVKLTLGLASIVAIGVLFGLGSMPSFVAGALSVLATVALVSWILGMRQPTPEDLQAMIQDSLAESLDAYSDVMLVNDEQEED